MSNVYEKVGFGFVSKNPKHTPNSKLPIFTGEITINDEKTSIALWKKDNFEREAYSIQATKITVEETVST
jgi:hypothetical protein